MKKKLTTDELVDRVYEVNEKTPTKEIENLMLVVHNIAMTVHCPSLSQTSETCSH